MPSKDDPQGFYIHVLTLGQQSLWVGLSCQGGLEGKRDGLEDLDFYMGNDALKHSTTHQISYPIRHGLIEVFMLQAASFVQRCWCFDWRLFVGDALDRWSC